MSREEFRKRYESDPKFRLKRLLMLRSRNYRKQGGFPSRGAYEAEIKEARAAIAKAEGQS